MRKFEEKILEIAIEKLDASKETVSEAANEERTVAENLPGNLRRSKKYDRMAKGADSLMCAAMQIGRAKENIRSSLQLARKKGRGGFREH